MKTRIVHTIVSALLLGNLLITQVVLNFFHSHHSEISSENNLQNIEVIHTPAEKCSVCSLEIVHELFYHEVFFPDVIFSFESTCFSFDVLSLKNTFFSSSGRAPPLV